MKNVTIKIAAAAVLAAGAFVYAGCNRLKLPENWEELNAEAIKNTSFAETVNQFDGQIDPEQTWNMATQISRLTKRIIIGDYTTPKANAVETKANYDPDGSFPQYYTLNDTTLTKTNEDKGTNVEENADFFVLKEGDTIPIEFDSMDCWAGTTLGIYYYDYTGNRIEQELFPEVIGKIFIGASGTTAQRAAEKAKVEGIKTITLEDGTMFGVYLISRTGPDIDKGTYPTETVHKYYSEAALNPDGLSHVKLSTKSYKITETYTVKSQKYKVTKNVVAATISKCNEGDEGATLISESGYYRWNGTSIVSCKKGDSGAKQITLEKKIVFENYRWVSKDVPAYYRYVPEQVTYTEAKDGKSTSSTFTKTSSRHEYFIEYEDTYGGGDLDYNDIKIRVNTSIIKGSGSIYATDCDGGPWMILCEDLGTIADNDFNDVVFIVHRTSPTTMKLAYCATGATRRNYVLFNSNPLVEIHNVFGVDLDDYYEGSGTRPKWIINTAFYKGNFVENETYYTTEPVYSDEITVDPDMSMSTFYRDAIGDRSKGFAIKSEGWNDVEFSPAYKGMAPFIICVPSAGFKWPTECTSIFDAYPEFAGWAADHTQNTDWYLHPADDDLVVDLFRIREVLGR